MKQIEIGKGIIGVYTERGELYQTACVRVFDSCTRSERYPAWGAYLGSFCIDKAGRCYNRTGLVQAHPETAARIKAMLDAMPDMRDKDAGIGTGETRFYDARMVGSWQRELQSKEAEFKGVMEEIHGLEWEREQYTEKEKRNNAAYHMLVSAIEALWARFAALEDTIKALRERLDGQYLTA